MPELLSTGSVKPTPAAGGVQLDVDPVVLDGLWSKAQLVVDGGDFTPAVKGSGGNPTITYTSRFGLWRRVGGLLLVYVDVNIATISGGSGDLLVDGWPLVVPAIPFTQLGAFRSGGVTINAAARSVVGYNASGAALAAGEVRDNAPLVTIPVSALRGGSQLRWSMAFIV